MTPIVVLDACVLYPAAQRDLFMWLAAGGTIRAHWTNELAKVGLAAETPDAFLCRLLANSPAEVIAAFLRMRENL